LTPAELSSSLFQNGPADSEMTWFDLRYSEQFVESSERFCNTLRKTDWNPKSLREGASSRHFVDVGQMLANSQNENVPSEIRAAGKELQNAMDPLIVKQERRRPGRLTESLNAVDWMDPRIKTQRFHRKTGWGHLMSHIRGASKEAA
jgi:hypothetical protein